jgi:hypothetical protein
MNEEKQDKVSITPIISIDFDEFEPDSYRAVVVRNERNKEMRFATGDVIADYQAAMQYCAERVDVLFVLFSSSVDHFVTDVPGYRLTEERMLVRDTPSN